LRFQKDIVAVLAGLNINDVTQVFATTQRVLKGQALAAYNNAQRNQHEFLWETARVAARDASAGGGG
jgi:hypothetical protein